MCLVITTTVIWVPVTELLKSLTNQSLTLSSISLERQHRHHPSSPAGGAVAAALPSPDLSERRPRPLTACLLPIGSARPRLTNGANASAPASLCRRNPARWAVVGERWAVGAIAPFLASRPCFLLPEPAMPQFQTWEEFSRAAEKLYLADPMKVSRWRDGPGDGVFSTLGAA